MASKHLNVLEHVYMYSVYKMSFEKLTKDKINLRVDDITINYVLYDIIISVKWVLKGIFSMQCTLYRGK